MTSRSGTFAYKENRLGDTQALIVETSSEVFKPTSTTNLLLKTVRQNVRGTINSALDLGCGCGIIAVALAKLVMPEAAVCASDISAKAVQLATHNAKSHQLSIDCRTGSMFAPWAEQKFDLIVNDVAAMAEPVARLSRWYPPHIASAAGDDGSRWTVDILSRASEFLENQGQLFFPVLTLSNEHKILEMANAQFANVELLAEEWYPLGSYLLPHLEFLLELRSSGKISIIKRDSRWCWATKIYRATNDK